MIGQTLGHYRIVEKIGAGGMGVVYRAHDERLNRDVALKVLRPDTLADERARKKLRKEALTLAKLSHPNIAAVYDFDTQAGVDYLVTEYLPGATLAQKLSSGGLPEREVATLGAQVAAALEEAHERGIVHRDLKPGNIALTPKGQVKVLDFGLARTLPAPNDATLSETLNSAETIVGTLPYMAPEQLRGQPGDERSDIHAAGTVLYELATGQRAFPEAQTPRLIDSILHHMPPSPRALNRAISAEFERIVLKALDKDPQRRFQSSRELRVDLERLVSPTAEDAAPPSTLNWKRLRRAAWSHPRWTSLLAIFILAILFAVLWSVSTRPVLSFYPRDWILLTDFDNQTRNPLFNRSLLTALTISLEQSANANIFPRSRVEDTLRRMGKPTTERIDEGVGREICQRENIRALLRPGIARVGKKYLISARLVNPLTGATVRSYQAQANDQNHILSSLDDIAARLRRDLGESLAAIQTSDRPLPKITTSSLSALKFYADGQDAWDKGKYAEAVQLFKDALQLDPDFAEAHSALGNADYSFINNDPVDGRKEYELALKFSSRTTERERLSIEANYAHAQGHVQEASQLYQAYLDKWPDDEGMCYDFANLLGQDGRESEAIAEYKEALRIAPTDARVLINMATSYNYLGEIANALGYYEKAFKLEPNWVTAGNLNHEYGFALVQAGQEDAAKQMFALALAKPGMRGFAQRSLALLALYHGRYRDAGTRLTEALLVDQANKWLLSEAREHIYLSIVAEGQGDRARQLRELDAAAKLVPGIDAKVWMGSLVGSEYARCGNLQKSRRLLRLIQPLADQNSRQQRSQLHVLEGEIALVQRKPEQATNLFLLADKEMHNPITVDALARSYQAAGNLDRAIATYTELVGLESQALGWEPQQDWLAAHYYLAKDYATRGEAGEAAPVLNRLLALWKDGDAGLPLLRDARLLEERELNHRRQPQP